MMRKKKSKERGPCDASGELSEKSWKKRKKITAERERETKQFCFERFWRKRAKEDKKIALEQEKSFRRFFTPPHFVIFTRKTVCVVSCKYSNEYIHQNVMNWIREAENWNLTDKKERKNYQKQIIQLDDTWNKVSQFRLTHLQTQNNLFCNWFKTVLFFCIRFCICDEEKRKNVRPRINISIFTTKHTQHTHTKGPTLLDPSIIVPIF